MTCKWFPIKADRFPFHQPQRSRKLRGQKLSLIATRDNSLCVKQPLIQIRGPDRQACNYQRRNYAVRLHETFLQAEERFSNSPRVPSEDVPR